MTENRLVIAWGHQDERKEVEIRKEYKKTPGGHGYVNYLNCGEGSTYVKRSNLIFNMCYLLLCQLYHYKTINNCSRCDQWMLKTIDEGIGETRLFE